MIHKGIVLSLLMLLLGTSAKAMEADTIQALTQAQTDSLMRIIDGLIDQYESMPQQTRYLDKKGFIPWLLRYLANTNQPKDKPFDCSFVIGPYYDNTYSFGLGGALSGIYSWDRSDKTLPKSDISLFVTGTIKGVFAAKIEGHNFTPHDRLRLNYSLSVSTVPQDFWGMGYEMGKNKEHGDYHQFKIHFKPYAMYRLTKGLYFGPQVDVYHVNTYKFAMPDSTIDYLHGQREDITSLGAGAVLEYDTRDFILNPARGQYVKVEQMFYPKGINRYNFDYTDLTFRTYHPLWKKCTLAAECHGMFTYGGEVPWTMLAQVGDDGRRMRGYYEGRFRDKNIIEAQLEFRQMIAWRFGVTAFVGAANIFPSWDEINLHHTLPNYGLGLRWEFKPRVNLRLDCGFTDRHKPGIIFNMSEAF